MDQISTPPPGQADEPEPIVPRTIRYQLTSAQATAALQLAGVDADGSVLTPPGTVADPLPVLRDAGLLDGADLLPPFLIEALAVAAAPGRLLHALATVPGAEEWTSVRFGAAATGGPYVTVHQTDEAVDLTALESPMEVAAVLDDVFRLTSYPTHPVDPDLALTLPAWVGLLAVADHQRTARLRAELERRQSGLRSFVAEDLDRVTAKGVDSTDTRWAVTQALPLAPVALREGRPDGEDMLAALAGLDLLTASNARWFPSESCEHLLELIDQAIIVGSLTLTFRRPGRPVRGGELLVYRGPMRLGMGIWTGTADAPALVLTEPSGEAAVAMVKRMAELPDGGCGAGVAESQTTAFVATHHVPHGGLPARSAPDAALVPSLTIAGGTGLVVVETTGAWARVRTEAGHTAWVDSRRLQEGPPWRATHVVAAGGLRTRARPDPTLAAEGALTADTEVQVLETHVGWARVRVASGGEAWVDGRRLRTR